jgi:hypothetical protein
MKTAGALMVLLIEEEEILLCILQVALLEEIIQAAGRVEAAAEVKSGPLESALGELDIGRKI